ncbi:MAG: DUF6114 domain-containing protein [Phycisphaeraceae bacterium]
MAQADSDKPVAAFVVSLLGGVWMILASLFWGVGWGMTDMQRGGRMTHDDGMGTGDGMGPMPHHGPGGDGMGWMHQRGIMSDGGAEYAWWPWIGLAAGVLVILGAVMLYTRPEQRVAWGTTILVVATVSLFFGAGGIIGSLLAIIGGILALIWHPATHASPPERPQ